MPQLDFYAFENQIIYLIFFFLLFSNFFSFFFLPNVFISLRVRFFLVKNTEWLNFKLQLAENKLISSINSFFDFILDFNFLNNTFVKLSQNIWLVFFSVYPIVNSFFIGLNFFFCSFIYFLLSFPVIFLTFNLFNSLNDFFISQSNNKLYDVK